MTAVDGCYCLECQEERKTERDKAEREAARFVVGRVDVLEDRVTDLEDHNTRVDDAVEHTIERVCRFGRRTGRIAVVAVCIAGQMFIITAVSEVIHAILRKLFP